MQGDIQNQTEKLKGLLKKINYLEKVQIDDLIENNPTHFLKMIHHTLIDYNAEFYKCT